ncbi:MAG: alpha/beta hydrolase [Bryobacteraceae bacterium]|nr:alpha/beta hydrolase [Bryobacteraceae bacterium]
MSCRRGFESDQFLGAENRYRNYTNPANPNAFTDLNLTDLLALAKNKHVCILVHGFNNQLPNVMSAYWEVVTRMNDQGVFGPAGYGLVVGFTWPGMATPLGYFTAMLTAKKAGPFLLDLVNQLRGEAHTVDVQTHSLGARVALTAVKNPKKTFVDNLILSAAAVDNHLLEPDEDFFPAMDSCNRCLVYHSRQDSVLRSAFRLADIADGFHKALGQTGPRSKSITLSKTPNVYVVDCTARVGKDHSGYRKTNQYFQHWAKVLQGGALSRYDELS